MPEINPQTSLKLKVEINTREHASLLGIAHYPFVVDNGWYQAQAEIAAFSPEELFGTRLRALLQRGKNRDLFDLHYGLEQLEIDDDKLIACLHHYLALEGRAITRAVAERRMLQKLAGSLVEDIAPLLPSGVRYDEVAALWAFNRIWMRLIRKLRGEEWKSTPAAVAELRLKKYPMLLT